MTFTILLFFLQIIQNGSNNRIYNTSSNEEMIYCDL